MKKYLTAILTAAGLALGAAAVPLYFRWRTRRNAEATKPKIDALLDEMIAVVSSHRGRLDDVVMTNESSTVNDETRERSISLYAGGQHLSVELTTKLMGRKAGKVFVRMNRSRGEARLHLYWPDAFEYWPMEPWLKEKLDRLDALVGTTSRRSRIGKIMRRFGVDDDDGTPTSN